MATTRNPSYIMPAQAGQKIKMAYDLGRPLYVSGATHFGKTELVKHFLSKRNYTYRSCAQGPWTESLLKTAQFRRRVGDDLRAAIPDGPGRSLRSRSGVTPKTQRSIIVVDDVQCLEDEACINELVSLSSLTDVWLILIGRAKMPYWFEEPYVANGAVVIREQDMLLTAKDAKAMADALEVSITLRQAEEMCALCQGQAYMLNYYLLSLLDGDSLDESLFERGLQHIATVFELSALPQWPDDLRDFFCRMSVVGDFTLELADFVCANGFAKLYVDKAQQLGQFLSCDEGTYKLRDIAVEALANRATRVLGRDEIRRIKAKAASFFEQEGDIVRALRLYDEAGSDEGRERLLAMSLCQDVVHAHYFELQDYYRRIPESEIAQQPRIAAALSLMNSLALNVDASESWYEWLREQAQGEGADSEEAQRLMGYLDLQLPHRRFSSTELLRALKEGPFSRGGFPCNEFNLSGNLPGTLNGIRDHSLGYPQMDEAAKDEQRILYRAIFQGPMPGLWEANEAELRLECGDDDTDALRLLADAQIHAEIGGRMDVAFAAMGMRVRLSILHQDLDEAVEAIEGFESTVPKAAEPGIRDNLRAMRCRIALYDHESAKVSQWLDHAPDENGGFNCLDVYGYLTKVRVYLARSQYVRASYLLERLKVYEELHHRTYFGIECGLLEAIAGFRTGQNWREPLHAAIVMASDLGYVRVVSELGSAILPLLRKSEGRINEDARIDHDWFKRVMLETETMARAYAGYLGSEDVSVSDFSPNALRILSMQAEGMTIKQMADAMNLTQQAIKYHAGENYRKLGVKGKTEAVLRAKALRLID